MKNSEILFDVIGEVDESLLPDFYAIKKKETVTGSDYWALRSPQRC